MGVLDIDTDDLPDSDAVPAGQYRVRIDEVDGPHEDKNHVKFVKVSFTVINGDYVNRKFKENYVPLTKEGARASTLKKIMRCVSFAGTKLRTTDDLVGYEGDVVVKVRVTEDFGDQNQIASYIIPVNVAATT